MNKRSVLSLLLFACVAMAYSQVTTANMKGVVLDADKLPLFGANVVAVHGPTGTKYGAVANEDGRFSLLYLRVGGPYTVTVSFVGFKNRVFRDVYLQLGQTKNIEVVLASDSQQLDEVVVVSEAGGTFGSDRTGAETSVGSRELTKLPTITRSTNDFTRLEPTASNGSFGGRNDQFNNFSLDGAIFNNPFGLDAAQPGGQTDATPVSIDAIEQIQVSTAPYDVTQSGFTGASVNAVTKSGTNEFHGSVYGFFRNESMTGGKIKGDDVFKADLEQIQYGVSVGGPIVKNKLFFFANFEANDRTDLGSSFIPNTGSGSINESRVTEADFQLVSNILKQVVIGQDAQGNDVFYDPGRYSGFTFDSKSKKGIFKLDWNINEKNRLAIIYNFLDASKEKPAHPTAIMPRGPNASTLQFENSGYEINNQLNSVQLELNSTLSDKATNKLQLGYTHFDDFRTPKSTPAPVIAITDEVGASNYIIAGHEPFSIHNKLDQKVFQLTDNLNFFHKDHTFTIGFSFEKFQFDNSFNLTAYGFSSFAPINSIADFRNLANEAALVASYQGLFDSVIASHNSLEANGQGNTGGWALAETNVGQLSFYMQDEWNVTEDFKLTYGVRFDKPLFFDSSQKAQEVIDRSALYLPNIPYYNPNNGEEVFFDSTKMPSNDWLISPRVGFNWDVKGDRSLQLRGGSGLFTGRFPFVWLGNQIANPNAYFYTPVDPDYKFPQVWRTNIGVDKRLENGIVLTADLSYTKDINGPHVQNWGLRPPTATLAGVDNRAVYAAGDKQNTAYTFSNSDEGRIWNASLKGEKNFSNGLYTMLAYNFMNAKDVNSIEAEITSDAFDNNAIVGDANTPSLSNSKYGDKHRIIGVASKEFSTGTTISTFFEYVKGARYNYIYAGDINNDGSPFNDLIYIPTDAEINSMNWSSPGMAEAFKAFVAQDDYLSDNRGSYAERYGALAPWRGKWDLKILQDIKVSEGNRFQISLDVLNVGNLINSNWGVIQVPTNQQVLGVSVDATTYVPTYTFDEGLKNTFSYDAGLRSRWQAQIGVRYIF
ncbi:MAG: carboxypeptidase regulatory-like domain-containing protein [Flavobacteriaceae bacterium]|nr:carboxypeptidase regulatory-like domain-containing protein [Flavobacteriaceae bacterium]